MRNIPYRVKYLTLGPQVVELDGEAAQPCGAEERPWGWTWSIYSLVPSRFQFALSAWCLQLDVIYYPFPYRQWGK